jgi:competence protein ComEA
LPGQPFDPGGGNSGGKLPNWLFGAGVAVAFVLLLVGGVLLRGRNQPTPIGPFPAATITPGAEPQSTLAPSPQNAAPAATPAPARTATIKVHVTGHVNWPGVYDMPPNTRVQDAIARAGGARPEADVDALNLAAYVQDGSKITVPAKGETVMNPVQGGGSVPAFSPSTTALGPVNVNTASQAEIEALPGVGPKLAARIIAARAQTGGFHSVEEIGSVPGIGPKKLEQMRPYLTVN